MSQPKGTRYYVLGPRPRQNLKDRIPFEVDQQAWQAEALDKSLTDGWDVENIEIRDGVGQWRVYGSFTGLKLPTQPELFRVVVTYQRDGGASRRHYETGAPSWARAEELVDRLGHAVATAVGTGNAPDFSAFPSTAKAQSDTDADTVKTRTTVEDYAKVVARVKRLIALAGKSLNPNEPERRLAAKRAAEYLTAHPTPIRWLVKPGLQVRVVESKHMAAGLGAAKRHLKTVPVHGQNWFFEAQRVQGAQAAEALQAGWLQFERHGYTVFVPAGEIEVHL